jgi:hypothetical protein
MSLLLLFNGRLGAVLPPVPPAAVYAMGDHGTAAVLGFGVDASINGEAGVGGVANFGKQATIVADVVSQLVSGLGKPRTGID